MAAVTVSPETFHLVSFDADRIRAVAEQLADQSGFGTADEIRIEVDETTPFGRSTIESLEPAVIRVESGGFEDPKRPKQMSEHSVTSTLGRALWVVADRRLPGFSGAPAEADLTVQQQVAWDVYALGRCARAGHDIAKPRLQYLFRNRHGFADAADAVFERLWTADGLTWADIEAACAETASAQAATRS